MLLRLTYLAVTNTCALLRLLPMSDRDKDIEILALRHQLLVLHASSASPGSPTPTARSSITTSYDRAVDNWIGLAPLRRWTMNASPSAGVHCHGYNPVNSSNRWIRRSRGWIVEAWRNRADCCRAHPSFIAEETAGSGFRRTTFGARARRTEPGASATMPAVVSNASLLRLYRAALVS
ncbi:hypothetical protein OHA88_02815 [Streptomyces sp. NBC_00353]|uniref:hypothetical protein n=1 Tax=Streptomyces sp. NBC_00353 TaxID=2975722 RepID=UPI00324CF189